MTASTGAAGSILNVTRRATSCSVRMPAIRPAGSTTRALEARAAVMPSTTSPRFDPSGQS
jgi:hypothetical protein